MSEADSEVTVFTVAKANSALPLVRRIVADITREHPIWKDLVARYELAVAGSRADWGESPEMRDLKNQIDDYAVRINGYVVELEQIGCALKGFEEGLVDFYGVHEGKLVCLCWRHGEETISHWHDIDSGFSGRKPITKAFLQREAEALAGKDR